MADRCPYGCGAREGCCDCADEVGLPGRVAELEEQVETLEAEVKGLKETVGKILEHVGAEKIRRMKEKR